MLALVVFGLAALLLLKTDEFPDVQPPIVVVSVLYPGAAPEIVEREVIEPVEDVISGISGVTQIQSSALDSFAVFIVQFVYEKDLQEATQDIRDEINADPQRPAAGDGGAGAHAVRPGRPAGRVARAVVAEARRGPSSRSSPIRASSAELRGARRRGQVTVVGGVERELTVELRPAGAAGRGRRRRPGRRRAAGAESRRAGRAAARQPGRAHDPAAGPARDAARTSSGWSSRESNGRLVRLGDVADVRDGTEEPRSAAHLQRRRGGRHRHREGERATARPPWPRRSATRWRRAAADAAAGHVASRSCATPARAWRSSVGDVEDALVEGARAHRARGVPVPQLVALDGHHRPRAAGLGARVVHRRAARSASR